MGRNSSIEWTHHTFNPWWGCDKVSPACKNCYAEAWARRVGENVWGEGAPRRFFGHNHWMQPLLWNRDAQVQRRRARVFCASMADVFEERADLESARHQLWQLIEETTWLDWLLLTKRPQAATKLTPWSGDWPHNVWLGTTVENQRWATKRIPHLLGVAAKRRFLSCEPLLGQVDLSLFDVVGNLHWVIAGGESGAGARPTHPDWFRGLRDQCRLQGIKFHFKQWGNWAPATQLSEQQRRSRQLVGYNGSPVEMIRWPKKEAGRALDNQQWDEVPLSAGPDADDETMSNQLKLFDSLPDLEPGSKQTFKALDRPLWTESKAKLISAYLRYFVFITKHGAYIDGFTGPQEPDLPETWAAKLVLESEPRWLRSFYLCEMNRERIKQIRRLQSEQPSVKNRTINIYHGDFNQLVDTVLAEPGLGSKVASFCLLDQRTFECDWATVEKIAKHKGDNKIEVFYFLGTSWLDRSMSGVKDKSKLDRWWGGLDWRRLKGLKPHERSEIVCARFRQELEYRTAYGWPIMSRKDRGKIMYYMVHASDHAEAHKLMASSVK